MDKMLGEAIFDDFDPENRPDQSLENSGADWRAGESYQVQSGRVRGLD